MQPYLIILNELYHLSKTIPKVQHFDFKRSTKAEANASAFFVLLK